MPAWYDDSITRLHEARTLLDIAHQHESDENGDRFKACISGFIALAFSVNEYVEKRQQARVPYTALGFASTSKEPARAAPLFAFFHEVRRVSFHRKLITPDRLNVSVFTVYEGTDERVSVVQEMRHCWLFKDTEKHGLPDQQHVLTLCSEYHGLLTELVERTAAAAH